MEPMYYDSRAHLAWPVHSSLWQRGECPEEKGQEALTPAVPIPWDLVRGQPPSLPSGLNFLTSKTRSMAQAYQRSLQVIHLLTFTYWAPTGARHGSRHWGQHWMKQNPRFLGISPSSQTCRALTFSNTCYRQGCFLHVITHRLSCEFNWSANVIWKNLLYSITS